MKQTLLSLSFLFLFCYCGFGQVDSVGVAREVDSLIQVSRTLTGQRKYEEALQVNEQAIELTRKNPEAFSVSYANCQFNKGRIFHIMGRNKEAESFYLEALNIHEKVLGNQSIEYAGTLNNLAILYQKLGQYENAKAYHLEVLQIREKLLGREHVDCARSLNSLGVLYMDIGQYDDAEPLLLESMKIREKLLGNEHPEYSGSLNNLAILYVNTGRLEDAEPLYIESIALLKKAFGEENADYAQGLNNLASLYRDLGHHEAAESLYLKAISIREKTLGKEHPDYAQTLSNLAILYVDFGYYEEAEKLYLEANTIREKALLTSNPDYATNLNNLANLYMDIGRYEDSERLHLKSKEICEATLGKEHPAYAGSLNNLANLYKFMGRYEVAEKLQLEAREIWGKSLGKEHPRYVQVLHNLGVLYHKMGHYETAKSYFIQAIQLWKNTLGELHPNYSNSLFCFANLEFSYQNYDAAEPLFKASNIIDRKLLTIAVPHLTTEQLSSFSHTFLSDFDTYFSFCKTQPTASEDCFDNALLHKGFLLTTASQISKLALSDSLSTEKFNLLKSYHRRLAAEYAKSIAERKGVPDLEAQANTLEKDLTRSVSGFGEALRQVSWQEVQSALQPGEAALEFIRFNYYNPKITDSVLYAALLLKPGMETPAFISLFEEKQLESLLAPLAGQGSDGLNELYGGQTGESLYKLLWSPLEPYLEGVKTVWFSPAGLLHRLDLNAIPTGGTAGTLADKYDLATLGSTRQLVVGGGQSPGEGASDAVIFGGIHFEMDSTAIAPTEPDDLANSRGGLSFSQTDSTLRGGTWKYLKWSNMEADIIQSLLQTAGFQVDVRKSYAATEESFKELGRDKPSPRILHISTHGFFFPDPVLVGNEQLAGLVPKPREGSGEPVFKISEHPMIRSGLILAGANHAWQTGKPLGKREDGILTAYEISQMDLRNTELVVLSACETGLGDIRGNEGVYGLQRAFKIAGAKNLIMSLWQVPDFQTQELMTIFYQKWIAEKMTVRQALKVAQEEMRRKRYEPFYWAGFVLVE